VIRAALALCAALLAAPLAAHETVPEGYPQLVAVTGVDADDVLNVRASPGAWSEIVGTLAPDATGIEVVALDGRWGQINTGERRGWIAMRYTTPLPDQPAWPETFACFGTEPFWSLDVSAGTATFRPMDGAAASADLRGPATGATPGRAAYLLDGGAGAGTLVVRRSLCSDGMSDRRYGLSVDYVQTGSGALLSGCCSLGR